MRRYWWKILCIILLLYVTFFSLLFPLNPGLLDTDMESVHPGKQTIEVAGYNTHFKSEFNSITVLLALDSVYFCATPIEAKTEERLVFDLEFPKVLHSGQNLTLIINNDQDGTIYLLDAFRTENIEISGNRNESCAYSISTNETTGYTLPFRHLLYETVRNLMFHVPMWFTMFLLMIIAVWHSVAYLARQDLVSDLKASMMVETGLLFCVLGLVTGSIWARFTWTSWWTNDPQLNGALVTFLIYCAYIILRRSIDDDQKRATISAVFNIFCFAMLVVLLMILPRFTESLHPGKGDNPAFSVYDRGNSLKMLFYPAVIGWILMGIWIYKLRYRAQTIRNKMLYDD